MTKARENALHESGGKEAHDGLDEEANRIVALVLPLPEPVVVAIHACNSVAAVPERAAAQLIKRKSVITRFARGVGAQRHEELHDVVAELVEIVHVT